MDFDGLSSPPAMRSSLPPSSAPDPSQSVHPRSPRQPTTGALVLDDEAEEEDERGPAARKQRRPRTQANGDVPMVKDAVGESVAESFETFLKTCVLLAFISIDPIMASTDLRRKLPLLLLPDLTAALQMQQPENLSILNKYIPCENTS